MPVDSDRTHARPPRSARVPASPIVPLPDTPIEYPPPEYVPENTPEEEEEEEEEERQVPVTPEQPEPVPTPVPAEPRPVVPTGRPGSGRRSEAGDGPVGDAARQLRPA
jgi:hypothetical protein